MIPIYLDAFKTNSDIEGLVHDLIQARNDYAVITFTSPQTIATKFHNFVLSMLQKINFFILDEIHMFHSFRRSFRSEFNLLQPKFFNLFSDATPMMFNSYLRTSHVQIIW